ncbi:MAG: insulinase family protein [Pseudomonadales bacterium]|nr:insulinase family protein [Pseudomonadales bacterium]MDP4639577.1 insulinase family protein [Pseudomonadales bacterium]
MIRIVYPLLACLLLLSTVLPANAADPFDLDVDIPHQLFKLDNGLTVIVHEDHKAPIVAVNLWYHVGSKNEVKGKTGFAHLFEHLMFNGSENYNDDYFRATEKIGATNLNGTTNWDRTNYFQNVPTSALDTILWLESDRMGHLLGAITQEKLDEQRGVVQNEKRQGENQPYGRAAEIQYSSIYPPNHPYSWTTIGSMDDLNAADLEDVKAWFKQYYGAANTTLVIAGDVVTADVMKKVEHYFGPIEAGPPLTKQTQWVAKLTGTHKQVSYDRVPQTMLMKSWNIEGNHSTDTNYLDMVAAVLSSGKSSRLYKRLAYDEQLVSSVSAYTSAGEIAGTFEITAMITPGVDEALVDRIIEEELAKFLKDGPTKKELERIKIESISGFVRGMEKIGGFGGKSDILASNYTYTGDPTFYQKELAQIKAARANDLQQAARRWLSDGLYQLEIRPFPKFVTSEDTVDRSKVPEPGQPPLAKLDDFQRAELSNGLKVIVATRSTIPVVNLQLSLDAGYASDQFSSPGVAKLAMNMLDEGTRSRDALQINEQLALLGASISSGSNLDTSFVSLSTLKTTIDAALPIFADVILNPSFPAAELERLRTQQLTGIKAEQVSPQSMGLRVFPQLIYGEGHAYSNPLTGSGTLDSVAGIDLAALKDFHKTWFKPDHGTIIVAGDITMAEILPRLEKQFANWQAGDTPTKNIGKVGKQASTRIYLVDRPDSSQSFLFASQIATPKANPDEIATEVMNDIIGGMSTSRINMNLREDKHWSYGAYTGLVSARGQRPFYMLTSVQTDKTSESIAEVMQELRAYISNAPATAEELHKTVTNNTLSLSGTWESAGAVLGSISQIVQYGLPDDYFATYATEMAALELGEVQRIAAKLIDPDALVWVVVGDRSKIADGLNQLGYGEVILIDADGNRLTE